MSRYLSGFLVILSLTITGLHAEPVRLHLSECLKLAEQHNYDIKSAQSDINVEEGKQQVVRSMFFPQLSLTAAATSHRIRYADFLEQDYDNLRTLPGSLGQLLLSMAPEESRAMLGQEIQRLMGGLEMPDNIPDRIDHLQTSLMLTQPIFTGLRLTNSYRAVQQARQAAIHRHTEKKVELTYTITQTFYQALLMHQMVEIHRMALESGTRHLAIIESMYREGLASEWEYMKAQVNVRQL
ncbi:MAG: TolC family protein, partial [Candidatus Delongbacteria bacterium]|nr:TolC family protein [Candidatus Delongbacteria bacterium]